MARAASRPQRLVELRRTSGIGRGPRTSPRAVQASAPHDPAAVFDSSAARRLWGSEPAAPRGEDLPASPPGVLAPRLRPTTASGARNDELTVVTLLELLTATHGHSRPFPLYDAGRQERVKVTVNHHVPGSSPGRGASNEALSMTGLFRCGEMAIRTPGHALRWSDGLCPPRR